MWLFAMFDLPVKTKKQRRKYTEFRKGLLSNGFIMLQYSVYARFCASDETTKAYKKRVKDILPPEGQVRLAAFTDIQFGKMDVFCGKKAEEPEKKPDQLMLF